MEQEKIPNIEFESNDRPRELWRDIVLYENGFPVGSVAVVIPQHGAEPWLKGNYPDSPILTLLSVQDRYRRKGYATRLIAEAEEYARSIGATEIVLGVEHDIPARQMYEQLGYRYVLEDDNSISTRESVFGSEPELIPMFKELAQANDGTSPYDTSIDMNTGLEESTSNEISTE